MNTQTPPTKRQLDFCYGILKRVGSCKADEHGQPLFELSMSNADEFIKQHRTYPSRVESTGTAGDWGIPNY